MILTLSCRADKIGYQHLCIVSIATRTLSRSGTACSRKGSDVSVFCVTFFWRTSVYGVSRLAYKNICSLFSLTCCMPLGKSGDYQVSCRWRFCFDVRVNNICVWDVCAFSWLFGLDVGLCSFYCLLSSWV